ncbi:tethering complex subunit PEP5 NDAI_0K00900 [Naumovozyma dairenensis CBS 421]|uniref:E3 ubiquitin-protein ligase PEP5 n=1 Tax=Naumovozyma dairenensis (strain ATCC 10597 / BCRC 20456 / CBS 421 / NBRC 0211 / NRRL Y-12639) TaxID=1071378 RepID=G0WHM0_NAUDC|nr:hypothetical protein NDAI_0K00900 [Naumovozyma dairenensis CBS 421]CCD27281.1 hypothetical protein NDAI_0K00900 [Naumovozyma dairenensis CBS 421]
MSLSAWRQFQFYESLPIRDPLLGDDSPLYSDPTLSSCASIDSTHFLLATNSRRVKLINLKDSKIEHSFNAFEDGYHISCIKVIDKTFAAVIGEKTGSPQLINIYRLAKLPKDEHIYHSRIILKSGANTFPLSVVSISKDLSCIVVGYVDGKVLLIRGDIARDRGSSQRIIYEDPGKEPVTSLFLNNDASHCFVATTSKIMLFNTTGRNKGQPDLVLNSRYGVDLNCGYLNPYTNEFICSVNGSLEFYKQSGEKHSLPVELTSIKRIHQVNKNQIMLVSEENPTKSTVLNSDSFTSPIINKVIIVDILNQVIVWNTFISSTVIDIFKAQEKHVKILYLLASDGVLYKITKKSLEDQLNIVIQKEAFPFALKLAQQNNMEKTKIQNIHKIYGDFLYNKNMKEEATEQYIQCLDVIEYSDIISKFGVEETRDPEDMKNLAHFLWALIKRDIAKPDHVTLLLIVLIKLKDSSGLDYFLKHYNRSGQFVEDKDIEAEDLDDEAYFYSDHNLFDLDLILSLLKETKFITESYQFARKFVKDAIYTVEILLFLIQDTSAALEYTKSLPIDDALRILTTFSKDMLERLPNDTNALLIDVFTGKFKSTEYRKDITKVPESTAERVTSEFKTVFYSYTSFFNYMNKSSGTPSTSEESSIQNGPPIPTYHPPRPSIVFSSFISRPFEFVVFLEACLESYQRFEGFADDKQVILTTLYDLYLSLANDDIEERSSSWAAKAKNVLKESNKLVSSVDNATQGSTTNKRIDNSLMMLISHMNGVNPFSLDEEKDDEDNLLYTLMGDSKEALLSVFKSMTLTDTPTNCLTFFRTHANKEPDLYRSALTYFTSSKSILHEIGGEQVVKDKILNPITKLNILSLLEIIQLLSNTDVVTYGLIQEILVNYMENEQEEITRGEKLIDSYQSELHDKKDKLRSMLDVDKPKEIRVKNEKCRRCNTLLDLPCVFFKCGHIYHQRCLDEERSNTEGKKLFKCPKCLVELETSNKLYENQKELTKKADMLEMLLAEDDKGDRFKIMTEFIGRGGLEYYEETI